MAISPLHRAVAILGGQTALARELSTTDRAVKQGHVWSWLNRTQLTPPEFCIPIEALTKGAVTRYELRPDVFGDTPDEGALVAAGDPPPVLPGDAAALMNEEEAADAA